MVPLTPDRVDSARVPDGGFGCGLCCAESLRLLRVLLSSPGRRPSPLPELRAAPGADPACRNRRSALCCRSCPLLPLSAWAGTFRWPRDARVDLITSGGFGGGGSWRLPSEVWRRRVDAGGGGGTVVLLRDDAVALRWRGGAGGSGGHVHGAAPIQTVVVPQWKRRSDGDDEGDRTVTHYHVLYE
eukprot:jgi/Ulvmu1/1008/UM103_0036.1